MKPALQYNRYNQPYAWDDLPQGKWLRKQTERHLNQWLPRVFGYHMVKLGHLSAEIDCSASPIKHQVNVATSGKNIGVKADWHHLPFRENSIDAVLLAHNLDFTHDPHQLLREAHRILIPDGYLIITGFNPISLCGLGRFVPKLKNDLPWSGRFFSPNRVTDWLNLLGCQVVSEQRFVQRSLIWKKAYIKNKSITRFTHKHFSYFGAVYVLIARKRELPLTPIKPKWKLNPKLQTVKVGTVRMRNRG
ncbi:SAM-dependent methyltransferase [Saccharobesus litoralis]|uniref:SAM-dependent methyltransferase n=1 Tax=Saccharobesus litoralis TaxID=2172099 RepID=A0A2S0VUE3_9ALTE|nr:class I SAM-dependent methyltransferase [Saccharobesus litoralis]AWB67837.1 SAM-dependent methyltransferase [Saccharobesus litoralis]